MRNVVHRPQSSPLVIAMAVAAVVSCTTPKDAPVTTGLVGHPGPRTAETSVGNLWYHIGIDDDVLDIRSRLYAPPRQTTFFLPGEWAGRDDYADAIRLAGASTPAGPRELAISRDRGEVTVDTGDAEWVELHYRVELTARSDYHPQVDRGVLVAFGPTFLVTPARQVLERTRQIPIEVVVPEDWTVVSTWPLRSREASEQSPGKNVHGYVAADVRQLRDAFLVAGDTLRTERRSEGDDLVEVAFGPAVEGDTKEFADWVFTVASRLRERYGPAGQIHTYVRTRTATTEQLRGLGRHGGFVLDVPPDAQLSAKTRLLVAHEALHLWNGHLLVPQPDAETTTRWFKEGVTHYLALKMLARTGAIAEEVVLSELAAAASKYERNPVSTGGHGEATDRARYPYDFGVLVAYGLDSVLSQSDGDGLERWLVELLETPDEKYDERGLLAALRRSAPRADGRRVSELWRRWVRSREPIHLRPLFERTGLHWLPATADRSARLIPLDREALLYRNIFGLDG